MGWLGLLGVDAHAFTTRVHVALANDVYEALAASDGRMIHLLGSDQRVELDPVDAGAILAHPLEFRAGAIGPDNFVFPAMTDQTHALGLRPYDQCRDLYGLAQSDAERAYALGCLLHGATDAVAHHYVNWLTGETFTLNPITAGREESYDNVVRHIVAEAMVQDAALALRPDLFSRERTLHAIPDAFVARAVVSTDSAVWQRMSSEALPLLEDAVAENPDAALVDLLLDLDLAGSELVVLLPRYVELLSDASAELGGVVEDTVLELQDPTTPDGSALGVGPGSDGALGTPDDTTTCDLGCPELFTRYFLAVALLQPDPDDGEPVWTRFTEAFVADLAALPAAYVASVGNVSAIVTGPLAPGDDPVSLDPAVVTSALGPLYSWLDEVLAVDSDTVELVAPGWVLDLRDWLASLGVVIDLGEVADYVLEPVIEPIRRAIEEDVVAVVEDEIGALLAEYESQEGGVRAEYEDRLAAAAPTDLDGTALDHLFESGLWMSSFDIAAAALAEPGVVLPVGDDWDGVGGASFDASHTLAWMQAGVCPDIAAAVFPLGRDVAGLLSVSIDGEVHRARVEGDAPVECHDGALDAFTDAPDASACRLVDLPSLARDPHGSLSRAFPPSVVDQDIACEISVPGLVAASAPAPSGCGCTSSGGALAPAAWVVVAALGLRRRPWRGLAALAVGCGGSEPADTEVAPTAGPGPGGELREALGSSSWHADGVQLEFRAGFGLWSETRAPYGPSRARTMRSVAFGPDGGSFTTTVTTPEGWEVSPDEGKVEAWGVTVGPDTLVLVDPAGRSSTYAAGPAPAPAGGWVAVASAFEPDGVVDDALCDSTFAVDHSALFGFARGSFSTLGERVAVDAAAGVPLSTWPAGAITLAGVPGFAASEVVMRDRFVVRYVGVLDHPGGALRVRERDDDVEGGVWVFTGDAVGTSDYLLEVHSLVSPDGTADQPQVTLPPGPVPIEVVIARCTGAIQAVDVEVDLGGGWVGLDQAPIAPDGVDSVFPAAF